MRVPLAGGTQKTLLDDVAPALLPFFTTRDACALRLACREFLAAATEHPWEDRRTAIQGSIAAWRACFPRARCANVGRFKFVYGAEVRKARVYNADFVHFAGLRELNMADCTDVTDAAFVHLRGIHSLEMRGCNQLTDAAIAHLAGIQRLGVRGCDGITDAAFAHLRGIQLLNIEFCTQLTDAAFVHLRDIKSLFMRHCAQPAITDAAIAHLRGIRTLVLDRCAQATLTGATFSSLTGIEALCLRDCSADATAAARALGLPVPAAGLYTLGYACAYYPWPKPRAAPW
jgi:hypothetical protein